ncbi:MAG: N-6 DNA methylase [Nostoc sp.]|uniref:HsdM family class I SAM-dependent methyltransferase n=1 Tax=Nostoc sp. TaxID=1180 RepID=UPI002FF08F95
MAGRGARRSSEFRAYPWILKKLKLRDWNTANPNRNPKGEVWTQNECLANPEISKALGTKKPENVVIISSNIFWTIEAKEGRTNIKTAVKEAQEYANYINNSSQVIRVLFATGVAGNDEEGYEIRHFYLKSGDWKSVVVGKHPLERMLSKKEALRIIDSDSPNLERPDLSISEAVQLSNQINETLHLAKVGKEERALFVAILLLALHEDLSLQYRNDARIFINDINSRAEKVFRDSGRNELWELIKIRPSNETLEGQARALSDIISYLKEADILHVAQSADVLGPFFESFLRYGNTSKELGIVLTPRHICWLVAEALEIKDSDIIYDPAVGTGGFLIAAFNRVRNQVPERQLKIFAKDNLFGADDTGKIAVLAFINMYFRGDGKHNIKIDSCFSYKLVGSSKSSKKPKFKEGNERTRSEVNLVTKVMMNPPFALKNSIQKEYHFVDHGLEQLANNGLLFSILPASVMYERKYSVWRVLLLEKHTLKGVVSFPVDLFYPVTTESVGVFIKKGVPHDVDEDVLWGRIRDDGFIKRKGFRVEKEKTNYQSLLNPLVACLRSWIIYGTKLSAKPGEYDFSPITSDELVPQAHLEISSLEVQAYNQEVRRIYKDISIQIWDQRQQLEEVSDV